MAQTEEQLIQDSPTYELWRSASAPQLMNFKKRYFVAVPNKSVFNTNSILCQGFFYDFHKAA